MSRVKRLYLDTNLLIAYYYSGDINNQHDEALNFFETWRKSHHKHFELCCSHFTITEFTQAYITKKDEATTFKIAQELLLTNKVGKKYPFTLVLVEGKEKNYTFTDFFLDIQTILLNTTPRPGIADAIHATIMKNNKIRYIVTFNEKDFKNIEGITAINPTQLSKLEKQKP